MAGNFWATANDYHGVNCEPFRNALSARMDGEDPGLPEAALERHLVRCAACRSWAGDAEALARAVRVAAAEVIPDLTPQILAAWAVDDTTTTGRRWARIGLATAAVVQLLLALPVLLFGHDVASSLHVAHELASWEIAMAIGFLFAALRPARAWGMLPLVAALVACLVGTSVFDLSDGHAGLGETSHGLEVVGLLCLWALARRRPARPALRLA